ncbi:MAG: helix-turn-helix domain-containing protein [Pseudomonadota bacterium]
MHLEFYQQVEPIRAARPFVRRIIYCDCDEPITIDVPAPPTGYNHVGWALRGSGAKLTDLGTMPVAEGEVHLAGQTVRTAARVMLFGRVRHILAELTPVGLYATFGVFAEPLVNRVFSARSMGHGPLQDILNQVSPEGDMEEALVLFQRALVAQYAGAAVPHYVTMAAGAIEESQGLVTISSLLDGISERQLQRNFKRIVGCSPKYFSQLLRVNATILSLMERREDTLADIAASHGFSDQPHMVRSIQTFFGHAPSEIRSNVDMLLRAFPTASSGGVPPAGTVN